MKVISLQAGLRVHAKMTGRLPRRTHTGNKEIGEGYGPGWHTPPKADPKEFIIRPQDVMILL